MAAQELRNLVHELDGHVEGGTIGDHAGPLAGRSVVSLLVPKTPRLSLACSPMSACLPLWAVTDQMTGSGCWENLIESRSFRDMFVFCVMGMTQKTNIYLILPVNAERVGRVR